MKNEDPKLFKIAPFISVFFLVFFFAFSGISRADELSDYDKKISEYESQKLEYLQKLEELKQAKVSLQNEIAYFDTQINLTQTEINETEAKLSQAEEKLSVLVSEINVLGAKIENLGDSIDELKAEVEALLVRRYKESRENPIKYFLAANSLTDALDRLKYLATLERQDKVSIDRLTGVKVKTQQEKDVLDVKRAEVEEVKEQIEQAKLALEQHRVVLGTQRVGKAELLRVTQNDEQKYLEMLAKVEAEIAAMRQAVGSLDDLKFSRHIERGEVVGVQGSTGWSTGDHLHFAVYHTPYVFYQDMEDPLPYLQDGRLGWPIQAYCYDFAYECIDGHSMSQPYGVSDISKSMKWYPNDFHDAIDMFGPVGSLIYAAESGDIAYGTDSAGGNYAMIKHDNGLITMYWHLR